MTGVPSFGYRKQPSWKPKYCTKQEKGWQSVGNIRILLLGVMSDQCQKISATSPDFLPQKSFNKTYGLPSCITVVKSIAGELANVENGRCEVVLICM